MTYKFPFLFRKQLLHRLKEKKSILIYYLLFTGVLLLLYGILTLVIKKHYFSRSLESNHLRKYETCPVVDQASSPSPYICKNPYSSKQNFLLNIQGYSNIFLMETYNRPILTIRQACAVESAALHNPLSQVTIYMTSQNIDLNHPVMDVLFSIKNINIRHLNLLKTFKGTPLFSWYKDTSWRQSPYRNSHLSDALRYLLLWKHGGIYLDLDVVVLRSLQELKNCSGLEDDKFIGAGVLAFDKHHPFIELCLDEFLITYNSNDWGYNGPGLFTRVLKRICGGITDLRQVTREKCLGVDVHPLHAFYAIPWPKWEEFFEPFNSKSVTEKWNNSYVIHLWNKFSSQTPVVIGQDQAYEAAAKQHCPSVYNVASHLKQF